MTSEQRTKVLYTLEYLATLLPGGGDVDNILSGIQMSGEISDEDAWEILKLYRDKKPIE